MGDHEGSKQNENDDVSMKTKLFLNHFGTLRFGDKSIFHTLLGFAAYWDYKPTNAIQSDGHGVYTSDKNFK